MLQHEIEADAGIIDAALALNEFSAVQHPPPYVAGSAELQNLVQRLLTQNQERLRLPGSIDVLVTFGDVLRMADDKDAEKVKNSLLVDLNANNLLLVLTPVCDLQRGGAPRILLLVGTLKALEAKDWSYGSDARTPSIMIDGALHWVRWNLKHIDTVSWGQLEGALQRGDIRVVARLREAHALELQQRVLSGLGRVGLVATLPATFPVEVEAFYADTDGKPARLEVPALADGAVCFVGRDENGNQVIRLVVTEGACDGIEVALAALPTELVAEAAQKALGHIRGSSDLRRMLAAGLDLKNVGQADWTQLASETGQPAGVPKMGLIAWNYEFPDKVIKTSHLNKAGIILLLKDAAAADTPGLDDAIQSGMIVSEIDIVDADDEVQS